MAKDLWVPIFVHTSFSVREAQRMSLAQAAAETRESDLLRDTRRCYHQLCMLRASCVWPEGTKVAQYGLGGGGVGVVGTLAVACLFDTF